MNKTKVLLSTIMIFVALLYVPSVALPAHAATGTICIVAQGSTSCPTSAPTLTGTTGTQLRVAVFIQVTDPMNGFDVTLLADHTVLLPAGIDITGSIIGTGPSILAECLQGILKMGAVCSSTDTIDTIHLAAVAAPGALPGGTTPPGSSGLLFTAIYNITSTTTGISLGYQTGCKTSSVSGTTTCVDIANGTPTPVSEAVEAATFSTTTTPDFVMSASPNSISLMQGSTATSLVTLTSVNSFAGMVNLQARVGPPGPVVTLSSTIVTLASGGTGTSTLTISTTSTTPPGSYTATVNGTSGSLAHFVAIGIAVIGPPPPDFTISSNPVSLTIQAGNSGTSTITLASVNSFAGTITLTSSVTNTGISATLSATSVTLAAGGTGTSILTISTTTSTQPGSYSAMVTATSGALSHLTGVTITVTAGPGPDFTITANPSSLTIAAGSSATSTITIATVNGFSGTVSLSVTSSPGLTASISTTSITGSGTAVLTVSSSAVGSYSATITGVSGSLSHSTTVAVNVPQVGEVCIVSVGSTACPSGFLTFSGTSGNQLRVSVFIEGTAPMSGFDITLLADHTIFVPTGINLTGSMISTPSTPPTILAECLQGVLVAGSTCSLTTDTIDTLHLAAIAAPGALPGGVTPPGASGLLFTAIYNIASTTTGTVIKFQTGCSTSSVGGGICIDIANGTCCPVPETIPTGPAPDFAFTASPASLTINRGSQGTSTITLASIGGFTGTVSISSSLSPSLRHGPSATLNTATVTLSSGGTGSLVLTISTNKHTPTGTYTITINAVSGSLTHSITVTVTVK